MSEACKEKTTFVCRYGTYKFEVMPFELMNAPSTFQRMMDEVLRDLPFVMVYVDDVVISSKTMEEHLAHCREVFHRIGLASLKVKLTKCSFAQSEIKLLGHVIDGTGIRVDVDKIADIVEAPVPRNKTELRSFLGLAGYFRRFIRDFAKSSAALHATTSAKKFEWSPEMQAAFEDLKKKMTTPPVLAFPDFDSPFIVEKDASSVALGAVLSQKKEDGKVHPIQYASRSMTPAERNYATCEREALAVVFALKKFLVYLLSSILFTVLTDHQALQHAFRKKDGHGRLARWLDLFAEYEFEIKYRPGVANGAPDYLSRIQAEEKRPGHDETGPEEELVATISWSDPHLGELEEGLLNVARFLSGALVHEGDADARRAVRRRAKSFML
eukprot:gb/GEZJ01002279.1/.p1 GENE.gb/GEZJ01002279.1/~~gb/GEZJ01002279.1/.p1  ORF type:complete len:384 (+),score=41.68 gb/GEZJ01002279.1/:2514-3665(+)